MLIYKKDMLARVASLTSYYASIMNKQYSYTVLNGNAPPLEGFKYVSRPWGLERKASLNKSNLKSKISREDIHKITQTIFKRIDEIATWGGGSFGPYKILPKDANNLVTIKKKPKAKTRTQAIARLKELTFLVYGLTTQDELEAGMRVRDITDSKGNIIYTAVHRWRADIPNFSQGIELFKFGTTLNMRLGKTLGVILGIILNPYSDYVDLKDRMYSEDFYYGAHARQDYRDRCAKALPPKHFWGHKKLKNKNKEEFCITKTLYRTNLKTGVPDKIEIKPSYWFDCYDGPELPEFYFRLEYANSFSLQYSPEEKNKWILQLS